MTETPSTHRRTGQGLLRLLCLLLGSLVAVAVLKAQTNSELRRMIGVELSGTVSSVGDGDTFDVKLDVSRQTIRIRIAGIDTPELAEPFGTQARDAARVLLFDRRVRLFGTDVDPFRRLVAKVTVGGKDAGLDLVSAGLACHATKYSTDRTLGAAETAARSSGLGFWATGSAKPACAGRTELPQGPFHGNRQTHFYHAPSCPNYSCKNCTAIFQTAAAAQKAGYRPAQDCIR